MSFNFTQTAEELQDIIDLSQNYLATPYNVTSSYAVGNYCTREGVLYRCTASTSGAWNSSKWSAVTVGSELQNIGSGQIKKNFSVSSAPSGGFTNVGTLTVPSGQIWLVTYSIGFAANATGWRRISITLSTTIEADNRFYKQTVQAVNGATTDLCMTAILNPGTWYFNCSQNSGSSLGIYPGYSYVRIK